MCGCAQSNTQVYSFTISAFEWVIWSDMDDGGLFVNSHWYMYVYRTSGILFIHSDYSGKFDYSENFKYKYFNNAERQFN